jgi:hypothetical protein
MEVPLDEVSAECSACYIGPATWRAAGPNGPNGGPSRPNRPNLRRGPRVRIKMALIVVAGINMIIFEFIMGLTCSAVILTTMAT